MIRCLFVVSVTLFFLLANAASAESIVVIGDSLSCGPFGKYYLDGLSKKGNSVTLYCAVSSAAQNWIKGKTPKGQQCKTMTTASPTLELCGGDGQTPKLADILRDHPGARFIVGLGTNSLPAKAGKNYRLDANYRAMAKAITSSGSKCDWVGPPHLQPANAKGFSKSDLRKKEKNLNRFYDALSNSIDGSCSLIDSRDATARGTPGNKTTDGVHRGDKAGKYWAEALLREPVLTDGNDTQTTQ